MHNTHSIVTQIWATVINELFAIVQFLLLLSGGSGLNILKHYSKIKVTQKVHPVGQIFGWVWGTQTIRGARADNAHFPAKSGPKYQK